MSHMRVGSASIDEEIEHVEQQIIELAERLSELRKEREAERGCPRPSDCLTADEIADIERD